MIDAGMLVAGTVLGLLLGGAIISLLIFAAVSTAKDATEPHATMKSGFLWSHVAKYERTHLRTMGTDPDSLDW